MNERVRNAIAELKDFIRDRDDALAIPREAGQFVHALVLARGAVRGVEIGTSFGYSALWTAAALALNGGRLITIDHSPDKHSVAKRFFEAAGLDDRIECRLGTAVDVLEGESGAFDYVLNDADKENCIRYVELLAGKLAPRAVVLTDNTLTHPDQLQPFVAWIRSREDFASAHVPVGNGMELSVYLGGLMT